MVSMHIIYDGSNKCTAVHDDSEATIFTDAPVDVGGDGSSFSPTDLVATALAACIATTMAMYAKRHNVDLKGMKVHVTKDMYTGTPRRIGELKTVITIPSGLIPDDQHDLYERVGHNCPVYKSLHPDVQTPIEFIYEQ